MSVQDLAACVRGGVQQLQEGLPDQERALASALTGAESDQAPPLMQHNPAFTESPVVDLMDSEVRATQERVATWAAALGRAGESFGSIETSALDEVVLAVLVAGEHNQRAAVGAGDMGIAVRGMRQALELLRYYARSFDDARAAVSSADSATVANVRIAEQRAAEYLTRIGVSPAEGGHTGPTA